MKLNLRYYGDPILRKKAKPVEKITEEIKQLCRDMIETMVVLNGWGLAAPQVGHLLRIFISPITHENEKGEVQTGEPKVFINPMISDPNEVYVERSEGCLSVPKLFLPIPRPLTIKLEALDIDGNSFSEECYGYVARNRMHENDHLNGVLFFDRIKGRKRTEIEPILRRIKQEYKKTSY